MAGALFVLLIAACTKEKKDLNSVNQNQDAIAINNSSLWPKPANPVSSELAKNENIRIVMSFFEAYSKHDMEGIKKVMSKDVEWHIPGNHPLSGTKRGISEVMSFFEKLNIASFKAEVLILSANDNYVIDAHRGWSSTGKDDIDINWVLIYQIENGKIRRVQNFSGDLYRSDKFFNRVYENESGD